MEESPPVAVMGDIQRFEGRLNWGAMLVPWLWAPMHRLWTWTLLFWGLRVMSLVVGGLGRTQAIPASVLTLYPTLDWLLMVVLSTYFGFIANRALLGRVSEQQRLATQQLEKLSASERPWAVVGVVLLILIFATAVSRYSLAPLAPSLVLVGVWLVSAWMIDVIRLRRVSGTPDVGARG